MQKEGEGIALLHQRHQKAVRELVDIWYNSHVEQLKRIRQQEMEKATIPLPNIDPAAGEPQSLFVIERGSLDVIEKRFNEEIARADLARQGLLDGYSDEENWQRLKQLHSVNQDMTESLLDLDEAQRTFYSQVVGDNLPFPTDFINDSVQGLLGTSIGP